MALTKEIVPALGLKGSISSFTAFPSMAFMTDQELNGFLADCCQQLEQRQRYLVEEFGIGQCDRFELNLQDGLLTGHDSIGIYFKAEVTPIGAYSRRDRQWCWAWADPTLTPLLQQKASLVKHLTELTGIRAFQVNQFATDEKFVLELTAMACKELEASGCYQAEAIPLELSPATKDRSTHGREPLLFQEEDKAAQSIPEYLTSEIFTSSKFTSETLTAESREIGDRYLMLALTYIYP